MSGALPFARDEAQHLLAEALAHSAADATLARLEVRREQLTRFANNQVHQNLATLDHVVTIRAWAGGREGVASTHQLNVSALRQAAERALALARLAPGDGAGARLAGPLAVRPLESFVAATAECTPEERADALSPLLGAAQARGLDAAGALSMTARVSAMADSSGHFAHHAGTHARFTATVRGEDSSGWVARHRRDWRELDVEALGGTAIEKCERSRRPVAVEPGAWTVILEPAAVSELVQFLGPLGLGARAFLEGRSCVGTTLGERVTGERITLRDDAWDPRGFGCPFDEEGTPRSALPFIEHGVARGIAYDRRTAAQAGVASTGHAAPEGASDGPQPLDLVLETGSSDVAEMIAATERGLLVTRFWYVRTVDARRALLTGMTRDGTFLIEDGRIVGAVRNLRFNDTVLGTLARADLIGSIAEPTLFEWSGACVTAPALRVRDFTFSSVSPF